MAKPATERRRRAVEGSGTGDTSKIAPTVSAVIAAGTVPRSGAVGLGRAKKTSSALNCSPVAVDSMRKISPAIIPFPNVCNEGEGSGNRLKLTPKN